MDLQISLQATTGSDISNTFIPSIFAGYATIKYPATGYYRLRNYKGDHNYYLNASSDGLNGITDNTTATTVVRLINVENKNKTFKIQMQGKFAQAPEDQVINTLNTSEIEFTPTIALKNGESWVSLKNGDLENANARTNLNLNNAYNAVGWTAKGIDENPASYWKIEAAEDITVTLNNGNDGYYYATLCLPFDATISGAYAFTLEKNGNVLDPTGFSFFGMNLSHLFHL